MQYISYSNKHSFSVIYINYVIKVNLYLLLIMLLIFWYIRNHENYMSIKLRNNSKTRNTSINLM